MLKSLPGDFIQQSVFVILGTILGALVDRFLLPPTPQAWMFMPIALVGILTMGLLVSYSKDIHAEITRPKATVEAYRALTHDRNHIYSRGELAVSKAKESIYAVSYHFESPDPAEDRIEQYYRHIETVVESKANDPFEYVRVFQLPNREATLNHKTVGARAAQHAKWMCTLKAANALSPRRIHCLKSGLQTYCPLLIVDRKIAIVGIVTPTAKGNILSRALEIHDPGGTTISEIVEHFESIRGEAVDVELGKEI